MFRRFGLDSDSIFDSFNLLTENDKLCVLNSAISVDGTRHKILYDILSQPHLIPRFLAENDLAKFKHICDAFDNTPLLHCFNTDEASVDNQLFDAFLAAGYNPNEADPFGRTLLEHALHRNDNDKIIKLINAGANVNLHMFGLMDDNKQVEVNKTGKALMHGKSQMFKSLTLLKNVDVICRTLKFIT